VRAAGVGLRGVCATAISPVTGLYTGTSSQNVDEPLEDALALVHRDPPPGHEGT
jgi:hypothetical protein